MHRFFISPDDIHNGKAVITGDDAGHISRVLRLRPADELLLCNCARTEYGARIDSIKPDRVECTILYENKCDSEPQCRITLYQCLPKSDKLEFIIQKCVEIGAVKIVPVLSARCVARPSGKDMSNRVKRYQRIAYEAAKQCGRGIIPVVENITELKKCDFSWHELVLFCYEDETHTTLKQELKMHPQARDIGVIIDPEGGFEAEEAEWAKGMGAVPVTLGKLILRTETAGLVALSQIMYELEMQYI